MSVEAPPGALYIQELIGREVVTADGQHLGRVYEFLAEPDGDELCLATLLVGSRAWIGRYGRAKKPGGTAIRWEDIESLSPRIVVRTARGG